MQSKEKVDSLLKKAQILWDKKWLWKREKVIEGQLVLDSLIKGKGKEIRKRWNKL